jgi:hypothetical protein
MSDIRSRVNLVAAIAAVGMVLALIGTYLAWTEFPGRVTLIDIVIFVILTFWAIMSVRPSMDAKTAMWNIVTGLLAIFITALNYVRIAEVATEQSFTGVGTGIWIAFAGVIIYTIFSISDYMYKRNQ